MQPVSDLSHYFGYRDHRLPLSRSMSYLSAGKYHEAELCNISRTGMCAKPRQPIPVRSRVLLVLPFTPPNCGEQGSLWLDGEVIWADETLAGIRFRDVPGWANHFLHNFAQATPGTFSNDVKTILRALFTDADDLDT